MSLSRYVNISKRDPTQVMDLLKGPEEFSNLDISSKALERFNDVKDTDNVYSPNTWKSKNKDVGERKINLAEKGYVLNENRNDENILKNNDSTEKITKQSSEDLNNFLISMSESNTNGDIFNNKIGVSSHSEATKSESVKQKTYNGITNSETGNDKELQGLSCNVIDISEKSMLPSVDNVVSQLSGNAKSDNTDMCCSDNVAEDRIIESNHSAGLIDSAHELLDKNSRTETASHDSFSSQTESSEVETCKEESNEPDANSTKQIVTAPKSGHINTGIISPLDLSGLNTKQPKMVVTPKLSGKKKQQNQLDTFITRSDKIGLVAPNTGGIKDNAIVKSTNKPESSEIMIAFENLYYKSIVPDEGIKEYVIQLINRKKVTALFEGNYEEAEKLDKAISFCGFMEGEKNYKLNQAKHNKLLEDRQFLIKEERKLMEEKWKEKIDKQKGEYEQRRLQLDERHKCEISEFKKLWQNPECIRFYNKPSPKLLQLRHQEKKMALAKRYQQAKETKRVADELQEQEEAAAQTQIEEKMKQEYKKLKERQQKEIDKLDEYQKRIISDLEACKRREMQPYDSAIKTISAKKNTHTNKKFYTIPTNLMNAQNENRNSTSLATPRTISRLRCFRIDRNTNLSLQPIDDKTFVRISTSINRKTSASNTSRKSSRVRAQKV